MIMWICRNCETKNEDKDQFCACCGEKRIVEPSPRPTPPRPTPSTPDPVPAPSKTKSSSGWGKGLLISIVASLILSFIYNNFDDLKLISKTNSTSQTSSYSTTVSTPRPTAKPTVTPRPTSAVTVKPVITSIKLDASNQPYLIWGALSNAAQYHVYYSDSQSGTYTDIGSVTGTETTITGSTPGETEYYKIRAVMKDGTWSEYSNVVNIRIPAVSSSSSSSSASGSSSSSSSGSSQSSTADSYYVVGKSSNTFKGLYQKMCINLSLKSHPVPSLDMNGSTYLTGDYERLKYVRYDSSNEYECVGYIYNSKGQPLYVIRMWAGYHRDGHRIRMDVYYSTNGDYIGNIQYDLTDGLSNSSNRAPYYIPSQGTHKLE